MKTSLVNFGKAFKLMFVFFCLTLIQTNSIKTESKVENINLNKNLDLHAIAATIEKLNYNDLYAAKDTYVGNLTGYGADCALCSGFLGCNSQDVRNGTTTYIDKDYGEVRIVASSKNLPCGSIIRFNSNRVSENSVIAIVLDRGVLGTAIDLLMASEADAYDKIGRSQITYELLRKGWKRGE